MSRRALTMTGRLSPPDPSVLRRFRRPWSVRPPHWPTCAPQPPDSRDEYYGLAGAAAEWDGPERPPNRLVTVGSVDPFSTCWGAGGIRLGGRRWTAPYVQLDRLDDKVRRWAERQAVPKLVVATQSKLIEPVLDPEGALVPSTPLLSVHADVDDLSHIAAVLVAPPVVAAAWQRWFGSALAVDALKLGCRAARGAAAAGGPSDLGQGCRSDRLDARRVSGRAARLGRLGPRSRRRRPHEQGVRGGLRCARLVDGAGSVGECPGVGERSSVS